MATWNASLGRAAPGTNGDFSTGHDPGAHYGVVWVVPMGADQLRPARWPHVEAIAARSIRCGPVSGRASLTGRDLRRGAARRIARQPAAGARRMVSPRGLSFERVVCSIQVGRPSSGRPRGLQGITRLGQAGFTLRVSAYGLS